MLFFSRHPALNFSYSGLCSALTLSTALIDSRFASGVSYSGLQKQKLVCVVRILFLTDTHVSSLRTCRGMDFDPHAVLGVDRSASQREIRIAYCRRARECHPDKCGPEQSQQATERFQMLQRAYDFLKANQPGQDDADPVAAEAEGEAEDATSGIPFSPAALRTFFLPRNLHGADDAADVDADVFATFKLVSASWPLPYQRIVCCVGNRVTKKFVRERITALEVGHAAAFWLRPHNAMLHIERNGRDSARLSAWRVQLPPHQVMGMCPPEQCVPSVATDDVEWTRVANSAFYKLLAELADAELKEAQTKGRYEPNVPAVIMDYLLPVCCGQSSEPTVHVWKKVAWRLRTRK